MRYLSKKKRSTLLSSLGLVGALLLFFSYLYNLLGPNELWHTVLRLLAILLIVAFIAMIGVSLGRFEDEALEAEVQS